MADLHGLADFCVMDVWTLKRAVDLADVRRSCMVTDRLYAAYGTSKALRLEYTVTDGASAASLTGASVIVYGKRSDDTMVLVSGSVTSNTVSAALSEQFYAVAGEVECFVELTLGEVTMALARLVLTVVETPTDRIIDPGEELSGLAEGLAALECYPETALTEVSVSGVLTIALTDATAGTYLITLADGSAYTLTADGEDITLEEANDDDT